MTNVGTHALFDAIRAIAKAHRGTFRVTPNQNLVIADIADGDRAQIAALLTEYRLDRLNGGSGLRRNAMAESERYLPTLIGKIEEILAHHGLLDEPITIRMTGCPNGCARPYIAEIALTGRAPGKYNLYLGGGFAGQRLNKMVLENVAEPAILDHLGSVIGHFARERLPNEHLGDFAIRAGYVAEVTEGQHFKD